MKKTQMKKLALFAGAALTILSTVPISSQQAFANDGSVTLHDNSGDSANKGSSILGAG